MSLPIFRGGLDSFRLGLFVSVSTFEDTSRLEDSSLSDLFDERRDLRFEDFSLRLDFVDDDRLELIILLFYPFQEEERNGICVNVFT